MNGIWLAGIAALTITFAEAQQSENTYYVGHSLINLNMPAMVHSLAIDAGFADDAYDYQIGNGGNLWYQWDTSSGNEQGILYQDALPTGIYDQLVFTEAVPLKNHLQYSHTYQYADSLCSFGYAFNPAMRFYLYETWHCTFSGTPQGCPWDDDDNLPWRTRLTTDRALWSSIVDTLRKWHPDRTYLIVPGGQGLAHLYDAIEAGTVPGVDSIQQLFSDDIHLTEQGNYFIACVMFAALYGQSPEGLSGQTFSEWEVPFEEVPQALALRMQQIAWETVCSEPYLDFTCIPNSTEESLWAQSATYDPARKQILFRESFSGHFLLSDIQGRIISSRQVDQAGQVDLPALNAGIYFARLSDRHRTSRVIRIVATE